MQNKILVVDDEKIIRESLSYILKKEGYEVEEAENGKVAYDILRERSFDLIITDLEMPEMKGTELLEEIKKLNVQTSTIIITAYGSLETAISALRNGASDYILFYERNSSVTFQLIILLEKVLLLHKFSI